MILELPLDNKSWLTCHLSALSESARDTLELAPRPDDSINTHDIEVVRRTLNGLIKASPHLLKDLSDAALSVASPSTTDAREARAEIILPGCNGWPGNSRAKAIRVSATYIREGNDFLLRPSLVLEIGYPFNPLRAGT